MIIREFDPWKSGMCTCSGKYSLNPYTGCDHCCVYCYITGYIRDAFRCRPKKNVVKQVERELGQIDRKRIISMANSSDPYPRIEKELLLTRKIIELLEQKGVRFQVVTKSDTVARDADILEKGRCAVAVTITTVDERIAEKLEPGAPSPEKRVEALQKLKDHGVPVSVRIDPIIPGLTDPLQVLEKVRLADYVTASTLKLRPDGVERMRRVFPEVMNRLRFHRTGNTLYLSEEERFGWLERLKVRCHEYGISFGSCREGFGSEGSCDGSHLIQ